MAATSLREQNVNKAKLAEQAERNEDMVKFMEAVVYTVAAPDELTVEERNLLSVAYKNVIGARRASWGIISSIEQKEKGRGNANHVSIIRDLTLTGVFLVEVGNLSLKVSHYTSGCLVALAFRNFMNFRDRNNVTNDAPPNEVAPPRDHVDPSRDNVNPPRDIVADVDPPRADVHPPIDFVADVHHAIDLALIPLVGSYRAKIETELSEICAGILKLLDEKLVPAAGSGNSKAFDEAISELDTLGEDSYKDSTLIMQLFRDNLTLWTSDMQEDGTDEIKEASKPEDEKQQ
ncbi:hypothetical protein V6N11_068543 [Hibiscus sabdariffa]|uniref:14-3-3 domain-containing protein n=1 Tax=Hibiscus sabdariffa TaxID=183260 RepID=A0ABR2PAD8_9ROSI